MESNYKKLLFSVTKKDLEWEYFPHGGKGGQNANAKNNACRCKHLPSGAVAECREYRETPKNERLAFTKLVNSKEFVTWHKLETSRILENEKSIEQMIENNVNKSMQAKNLKIEVLENGRWTTTC